MIGTRYGEQLQLKQQHVAAALGAYPRLAGLDIPAVVGSPKAFGYRNQAKLVARRGRQGLLLGIYRPGSHRVVDIRQCPVHHPLITRVLDRLAAVLERFAVPAFDERTRDGTLRYVVVRVSQWTKSAQVILVTNDRSVPRLSALVKALQSIHGVVSIVQNINADPGNVIFGPQFIPLTRETALMERVGFLKLKTHAGAFLQANIAVARKLYEHALTCASPTREDVCVDLYCGIGALTFHLASASRLAFGIEASPVAVADAKANIRINGFHNVRFECGEVAARLPDMRARLDRLDVLTLNPPRKGADTATREAIAACAPARIVYVSCDPETLARDLDWFATHGFRPAHVQPFDLLPQTEHVECVATLERERTESTVA